MPNLFIDVEARFAQFQDSLDKLARQAEKSSNQMTAAFKPFREVLKTLGVGLSIAGLTQFVRSAIDLGDQLNKTSQKIGITVESLSALQYAAKLSDVSNESLTTGLARLARAASDASGGSKESAEAFSLIGVAIKDAAGNLRSTEDLLLDISDRFERMEDGAGKTAIAMRLFGRAGADLIPFLNLGRAGIEQLRVEAGRLGVIVSTETARAAEEFNDNMARFATAAEGAKLAIVQQLMPALTRVAESMAEAAREGRLLLGVWESLKSLSPFSDLTRAEKEITEVTDRLLRNERLLSQMSRTPLSEPVAQSLEQKIAADKARANELIKLLGVLRGETDAFGDPKQPAGTAAKGKAPSPIDTADAAATAKKELEGQLQAIDRALREEEQLVKSRLDQLQEVFQRNLIGFQDYYRRRQEAQAEALQNSLALADQEIAALTKARSAVSKESERADIENKLAAAIDKRSQVEQQAALAGVQDANALTREMEKYELQIADVRVQLQQMRGDIEGAAQARFTLQTRDLRKQVENFNFGAGDPGARKMLDDLRDLTVAQSQIEALQRDAQLIQERTANAEARVLIARELGVQSELGALKETGQARAAAVVQLQELADKWQVVVDRTGDERMRQNLENFRVQVEQLAASSDLVGQKFRQIGETGLGGFFEDILNGTKSVKDAFNDMGRSILQQVNKLVAEDIGSKLLKSIVPSGGGGSSPAGAGGFLDLFGGFLRKLLPFEHGGSFAVSGVGGTDSQVVSFRATPGERVTVMTPEQQRMADDEMAFSRFLKKLPGFADGGSFTVGGGGPGLIDAGSASFLAPAPRNAVSPSGQGGAAGNIVINQSFAPGTDRRTVMQAATEGGLAVQRALRRNS